MKSVLGKLFISLFMVGSLSALAASDIFIFQTAKIKIDNKEGSIFIGTPVKVLKKVDDKNVLVEFSGMAFGDKLYTGKTKSLLMATKKEGSFADEGQVVKVQAVIEKGYLSEVPAEIWEEHEEFFYEMCTQCHGAYKPQSHTMLEWDAILQTMSGFAQLYEDETEYLSRFLKANASNGFYPEQK
ncbi:MAG: hypothetical protein M0Q24_07195 [Sulfurimonas sp.]|uniref:hypothetical protein n=1 Tax=Sulfurimonas sp. TaxID=2022749 RepID=UPI0025E5BE38|nr:hypothetical protein [Sulfurimonas sp.]MCK9491859.1 hypothetical protein [Sulfurimonas sp.]